MHPAHILILAGEDAHAEIIAKVLRNKYSANVDILDTALLSTEYSVSYNPMDREVIFQSDVYKKIIVTPNTLCWWRRPADPEISDRVTNTEMAGFCRREYSLTTIGALISTCCRVVNHPNQERVAHHKSYQLAIARQCGLSVPKTLFSSEISAVQTFINSHDGEVIFKANHSPRWQLIDTRIFDETMLGDLGSLKFSPVIFQEFIGLGRDIRALAFNTEIVAFAAVPENPKALSDWRMDENLIWTRIDLPFETTKHLLRFMQEMGLDSGVLDLREDETGEVYFLEINPSGQFLFLEDPNHILAGQFAKMLINLHAESTAARELTLKSES